METGGVRGAFAAEEIGEKGQKQAVYDQMKGLPRDGTAAR